MTTPETHHAAGHALLRALDAQTDRIIEELAASFRRRQAELVLHLDELHGGTRAPADIREHTDLVDPPMTAGGIRFVIVPGGRS